MKNFQITWITSISMIR